MLEVFESVTFSIMYQRATRKKSSKPFILKPILTRNLLRYG